MKALETVLQALGLVTPRGWLIAVAVTVLALLAIGVPTAIIETPIFGREVPVRTQDYLVWAVTGLLLLPIAATFTVTMGGTHDGVQPSDRGRRAVFGGGLLSFIAVGCPVCNKLVLLALGTSGALNVFGPAQVYLGIASLGLLGYTLVVRARAVVEGCPLPVGRSVPAEH